MSLALTILGFVGFGSLLTAIQIATGVSRLRVVIKPGFARDTVILVTSPPHDRNRVVSVEDNPIAFGDLLSAQEAAKIFDRFRSRGLVSTEIDAISGASISQGNIVLLCGSLDNSVGDSYLSKIRDLCDLDSLILSEVDESNNLIRVNDFVVEYDWASQASGEFSHDYALIIHGPNPFALSKHRGRSLFVKGFTSPGTRAAVRYFAGQECKRWRTFFHAMIRPNTVRIWVVRMEVIDGSIAHAEPLLERRFSY